MHTMEITPNLLGYLNISVQAANLSDCRIESNRNFFCPNWNALVGTHAVQRCGGLALPCSVYRPTLLYTTMSRAKTAEPIEMPSGRQTRVSPSKRVFVLHLDRLPGEGKFIYFFWFLWGAYRSTVCSPSSKIGSRPLKGCGGNCRPGGK